MAKPELGVKRICQACGIRYYDFLRVPIVCPKCDTTFDPEAVLKSRRARVPAAVVEEPKVKVRDEDDEDDVEEVEDDEVEDDEVEDELDGDDAPKPKIIALDDDDDDDDDVAADDGLIEDTSDLGDDDDEVPPIIDDDDEL